MKDSLEPKTIDDIFLKFKTEHDTLYAEKGPLYEGTKKLAWSLPVAFLVMLVGYALGYISAKLVQ